MRHGVLLITLVFAVLALVAAAAISGAALGSSPVREGGGSAALCGALRAKPVQRGPGGSCGSGVESTVYQVRARLVEAKLEADSDIQLVIRDLTKSGTMIVEFPLVTCASGATTGAKTRMKNARNAFVAGCGMPGNASFEPLTGKATIRGLGFFDYLHRQTESRRTGSSCILCSGSIRVERGSNSAADCSGLVGGERPAPFTSATYPVSGSWSVVYSLDGRQGGTVPFQITNSAPPPSPPAPTAVTPGSYKGQTQTGNFVFFTVTSNPTVNGWRVNDIRRTCNSGGGYVYGSVDLGASSAIPVDASGRFSWQVNYDTTLTADANGDKTPAKAFFKVSGLIQGSSVFGTVLSTFDYDKNRTHYTCSNGNETWTANLLP